MTRNSTPRSQEKPRTKSRPSRGRIEIHRGVLDKAIEFFAPSWAVCRYHSRVQIAAADHFYGAGTKRKSMEFWKPTDADADETNLNNLPDLRTRSRDLERNNPLASGALKNALIYEVGYGPTLNAQVHRDILGLDEEGAKEWEARVQREWKLFGDHCDAGAMFKLGALCWSARFNQLLSGDSFTLFVNREDPTSPYELKLQILEADLVENRDNKADGTEVALGGSGNDEKKDAEKGKVFGGIVKDSFGQAIEYHVLEGHPGKIAGATKKAWRVIPAFTDSGRPNLIHLMPPGRPGQSRGLPYLTAVIEPLKQLGRYTESELMAAVVAGLFTVFVKSKGGREINPMAGSSGTKTDDAVTMGYGNVLMLKDTEDIHSASPGRPNEGFDPFFLAIVRQIGMALGQPMEVLLKHFQSSYSAARAAMLEAWRFFHIGQAFLADNWLDVVYAMFLEEAVARGRIAAAGYLSGDPIIRQAWLGAKWIWTGEGHIRPDQEMKGVAARIKEGISTREEETARLNGGRYWDKMGQRKEEATAEEEIEKIHPSKPQTAQTAGAMEDH